MGALAGFGTRISCRAAIKSATAYHTNDKTGPFTATANTTRPATLDELRTRFRRSGDVSVNGSVLGAAALASAGGAIVLAPGPSSDGQMHTKSQ